MGTEGYAVNYSGKVVGGVEAGEEELLSFYWDNYTRTDFGSFESGAFEINDSNQVAGVTINEGFQERAYIWQSGAMTLLDTLGGTRSLGYGINSSGKVVGKSSTAESHPDTHACLWVGDSITDIGSVVGGDTSEAQAINDSGQVVGYWFEFEDNMNHAFIWDSVTGVSNNIDTGTGWYDTRAKSINASGQVVGDGSHNEGDIDAFLWEEGVGMTALGNLGGLSIEAFDINDSAQIVGYSGTTDDYIHAFLWEDGTMYDLNDFLPPDSGWLVLERAYGINNKGQIVGYGFYGTGWDDAEKHGFLLSPESNGDGDEGDDGNGDGNGEPIPEPTSLLLLGFGVVGIAVFRKFRF